MSEEPLHDSLVKLAPIRAGERVPGDWFEGIVPLNVVAAETARIESAESFRRYRSKLPVGLRVGAGSTLCGVRLEVAEEGCLEIGEDCYLAEAAIMCQERIVIGNRVLVAAMSNIADSDFHPLDPALRRQDAMALAPDSRTQRPAIKASPVILEDDVWIGFGATVLKGIRVGRGAVVSAGSVVTRDVPPGVVVAGNPARVLGPASDFPDAS